MATAAGEEKKEQQSVDRDIWTGPEQTGESREFFGLFSGFV